MAIDWLKFAFVEKGSLETDSHRIVISDLKDYSQLFLAQRYQRDPCV